MANDQSELVPNCTPAIDLLVLYVMLWKNKLIGGTMILLSNGKLRMLQKIRDSDSLNFLLLKFSTQNQSWIRMRKVVADRDINRAYNFKCNMSESTTQKKVSSFKLSTGIRRAIISDEESDFNEHSKSKNVQLFRMHTIIKFKMHLNTLDFK